MMTKSKALTPQEIYRLRKQQEEREKLAYLPPGLVNHGNTCFMNSVLQGLIATRLLSNLILFEPILPEVQRHSVNALMSQRSPQLTNGHPWGGIYQKDWVEGMHIGDIFVIIMHKAWSVQRNRGGESLIPRQLLLTLGRKYDQYLDFAQQDAHEFLRILLDAMRMEEFDVIKKRQPPPARRQVRRRTVIPPNSTHSADPSTPRFYIPQTQPPDEPPLMSFVDMLFGGQLTSVLVCQKCKNISHTYEDFNDLSLSIKAEDYAKERKRDRFKKLAKKMGLGRSGTLKPAIGSGAEPETRVVSESTLQTLAPKQGGLTVDIDSVHNDTGAAATGLLRSSSVPPSPSPHVENQEPPFAIDSSRRRSLVDLTSRGLDISGEKKDSDTEDGDVVVVHHEASAPLTPEERKIEFAKEPEREDKGKAGGKGWGEKLGRRLSLTVGLGRSGSLKDKEKRRSRSRGDRENPPLNKTNTLESSVESIGPEILLSPPSNKRHQVGEDYNGDLDETIRPQDRGKHQNFPDVTEDGKLKERTSMPLQNNVSSAASSSVSLPKFPNIHRSKSPKPPKPSKGESEYLRQILADVTTSTSYNFPHLPGFNHNSNNLPGFNQNSNGAQSTISPPSSPHANSSWFLKLGLPLPSVEECLKMFTAVEVLDGENMVGCRRCWKIANGCYRPKTKSDGNHGEDGDDGDESDEDEHERPSNPDIRRPSVSSASNILVSPSSISSPSLNTYGSTSDSASFSSFSSHNGSLAGTSTSDTELVHSSHKVPRSLPPLPPPPPLTLLRSHSHASPSVNSLPPPTSNRLPLITDDTTVEVLASAPLTARPNQVALPRSNSYDTNYHQPYHTLSQSFNSQESLLSIPTERSRRISTSTRSSISMTEDETSEDDLESDASHTASIITTASSGPSTSQSISTGAPPLPPKPKKSKAPKQTMMRPAYKRYLIATPPPILVIHLKRFQQISKMPMMSFSSGFKKLDDYVSFPESLDLTPFLAPKKEDFGLGKKASRQSKKDYTKEKRKDKERCMYRLYAVVVHIGNMLGGHYIAYTALPEQDASGCIQELKTNSASRHWAYISDTNVRLTTLEEVLKAKAYICFYERI